MSKWLFGATTDQARFTYLAAMLQRLREQMTAALAQHRACVLVTGEPSPSAVPVRCRSVGLDVDCLIPHWADAAWAVGEGRPVSLLFLGGGDPGTRWLSYQGFASPISLLALGPFGLSASTDTAHRFRAIRVQPSRIDVVDESRGWGVLDTFENPPPPTRPVRQEVHPSV